MRHILSRVAAQVRDFNRRPLHFTDFEIECARRDICFYECRLRRLHGCAWSDTDGTFICLNANLYPEAKLIAAWHELAHVLLHPIDRAILLSRGRWSNIAKEEAEAEAVAVIATLPQLPGDYVAETNLERARVRLFQTYGV